MILVTGILESFQSLKDKTLKIVFYSNEPTPEQVMHIAKATQQYGYLAFKVDEFKQSEIKTLEGLKSGYESEGKSPSQRLRAVLYRNWEQKDLGYDDFNRYYDYRMEKIITFYKDKLD